MRQSTTDGLLLVDKPAGMTSHDVVLAARRAFGESRIGHARFRGYVGKLAVAQVAEKMVRSDRSDVDVHSAVVVIVAHGTALAVDFQRESGLFGYIRERSVLVVVIKRGIGFSGLMAWPIHGVDQQNVLPAVIVVVEETGPAAHGLRQILFSEGAGVVLEVDAGLGGNVGELDRP